MYDDLIGWWTRWTALTWRSLRSCGTISTISKLSQSRGHHLMKLEREDRDLGLKLGYDSPGLSLG